MKVVYDAGVVFSGAGWRGEAYLSLVLLAKRRVIGYATEITIVELQRLASERGYKAAHAPHSILNWYFGAVKHVNPVDLGKRRSRDVNDDPYLACALAADAKTIISRDEDLLSLGKPWGIDIITPRELISRIARGS